MPLIRNVLLRWAVAFGLVRVLVRLLFLLTAIIYLPLITSDSDYELYYFFRSRYFYFFCFFSSCLKKKKMKTKNTKSRPTAFSQRNVELDFVVDEALSRNSHS